MFNVEQGKLDSNSAIVDVKMDKQIEAIIRVQRVQANHDYAVSEIMVKPYLVYD